MERIQLNPRSQEGRLGWACFWTGKIDTSHESQLGPAVSDEKLLLSQECQLNGSNFSMRVLGCFSGCLERQVNEAVMIGSSKADSIMNSKAEFHQAPLVRVVPVVGLEQEQGEREERRSRVGRGG